MSNADRLSSNFHPLIGASGSGAEIQMSDHEEKQCSHCKEVLPVGEFGRNSARRDGLQAQCKSCRRIGYADKYKNARRSGLQGKLNQVGLKVCNICGETKDLDSFYAAPGNRDGRRNSCMVCVKREAKERYAGLEFKRRPKRRPERSAIRHRRTRFQLTDEQYKNLLETQGSACAICGSPEPGGLRGWQVDHDHSCCAGKKSCGKCIRGLLCLRCNALLAHARDNVVRLRSAAAYLQRAR